MIFVIKNKINITSFVIGLFFILSVFNSVYANISPKDSLKNYALLACIGNSIDKDNKYEDVVKPLNVAADFYFQNGKLPIEAYTESVILAKKIINSSLKNNIDIHGDSLVVVDCINFLNSQELEDIFQKYNKNLK
ncbi:hypothetical protein [uncultured Gilliamella sp.]|uniref:hypothetical protein n=1 Tax=uncultured Gilliamella sp. TaxID=1193505 RepID=UPI0025DE25A9|nr:hypothetical protein [uncultured Gilliamella sp.]